ncbi:hypothetical protein GOC55_27075 [Sinorhizobium medicae]|uniref:hypothetical protein n=1 Tax=Sinorhizobium medicae TaxID=110321 RepID=UPI000380EFC3|nr:hypothetical protein [Sinorhizobium medicae]MDX0537073.1 hypothetical protein [Sinorhizobium medicae]UFX06561.1 hypothetical protein SmedWSM1115_33225 [Sinorhizobium medicae WSM1115]
MNCSRILTSCALVWIFGCQVEAFSLDTIPIDENSPEVIQFRSSPTPAGTDINEDAIPDDLFVLGITAGAATASSSEERQHELDAIDAGINSMIFDINNKSWFMQSYPPPLGVDLYCSWKSDVAQTNDLESGAEDGENPQAQPPPSGGDIGIEEEGSREVEESFEFAGRPCTIRCVNAAEQRCTSEYINGLIRKLTIIQLGD